MPKIALEDRVPRRAVLREPQVVEQLVDVPVPSFDEYEIVLEEAEEDDEVEEEEELEMFDETTDRFEHSSWRPRRQCRQTGGAARSRTANKSSTRLPFVQQNVDVPVPQITVELTKEIAEQLVDVPMSQTWEFVAVVQIVPQGEMQEQFVEVTQFFPHERIVVRFVNVATQEQTLEVVENIPQERVQPATRSRPWCARTTDLGEIVEVMQLVRTAAEQNVAFPMPQRSHGCHRSWRKSWSLPQAR